jgi:DNA mismatch endonuclease (patch repair protein)
MHNENEEEKRHQRSYNMSRIRSKDTKPELLVRHWLFMHGYRYHKNVRRLPGTPDIVMRKYSLCIFIHGCFWHGHEHEKMPKANADFWRNKIEKNKKRDESCKQQLLSMNWSVITIWECQLKPNVFEETMRELEYWINHSLLIKRGECSSKKIALKDKQPIESISFYQKYNEKPNMVAEEKPDGYKK